MKLLLILALASIPTCAHARDYFESVRELQYKEGLLFLTAQDGCFPRKLDVELAVAKRRGPSPVNPRIQVPFYDVKVKIFTDETQSACRMLTYTKLENYPLGEAVRAKLAAVGFDRQPGVVLVHLPAINPR
jgi:hypothetical protein